MAEILSGLAVEILKKLGSLAAQEVGSLIGLNDELRKLKDTVSSIQAVLLDAEEQQGKSHEVRDWIGRLKKVFYEADDLLDDFATEVTHRKLEKNKQMYERTCFGQKDHFFRHSQWCNLLPTADRLFSWGMNIDPVCKLCLNYMEFKEHLFVESEHTKHLYWCGCKSHIFKSLPGRSMLVGQSKMQKEDRMRLMCSFAEVMYAIWIQRNIRIFEQTTKDLQAIICYIRAPANAQQLMHSL